MRLSVTVTYAVLVLPTLVASIPTGDFVYKVKEFIVPPQGWIRQSRAPGHHTIELRIALPQSNFPLLEQNLYEVR